MIDRLIEALRGLDPPPTPEELADTLWLARRLGPAAPGGRAGPGGDAADRGAADPVPDPVPPGGRDREEGDPGAGGDEGTGGLADRPAAPSPPPAGLYPAGSDAADSHPVRAPALPAIPGTLALTRALRPLRLTTPSRDRVFLDEDATARGFAETGIWQPVLRPSPERRLDLALVVDTAPSMVVWQRTAGELRLMMERLGAFRDVRVWYLDGDGDARLRAGPAADADAGAGVRHGPHELVDPTRRRVVLVVSDCIGGAWRDGRAAAALDVWGRHGPVGIAQPLPQRLWWRCGAAVEPVWITAAEPGLPNARLAVRPRDDGAGGPGGPERREAPRGVAVPVMELEPRWLGPWAHLIAGGGRGVAGVALFTGRPVDADAPADVPTDGLSPLERVKRFRAACSPTAFDLAGYLAAAPLRLPVMRLVQRAMLPASTPAHLAEVFLGGLLRIAGAGGAADDVAYEFQDGVRDVLLGRLRRDEALRVLREVWATVRDRLGSSLDFPALLGVIEDDAGYLRHDPPFAQVAAEVLARLGGRYSEVAQRLAQAAGPDGAGRPGGGAPREGNGGVRVAPEQSVWGGVPRRVPGFAGRGRVLAAVREALRDGPVALVPEDAAEPGGEGKTRIAVEYAHAHARDYDLVWWVPAADVMSARSALAGLARRLGTPLSDDVRVSVETVLRTLRAGRPHARWLLVFDDACGPDELDGLLPETGPGSRGDVLITSRDRRWAGSASPVEVGAFERAESVALLRRGAPRLTVPEADRLAGRLGDLPAAVEQAAVWHAHSGADGYLRLFDERVRELVQAPAPERGRRWRADAPATWTAASASLTLDVLRRERPDAARLLELWTSLGSAPVSGRLLAAGGSGGRSPNGEPTGLPDDLAALLGDAAALRSALRDIDRFALGRLDPETGDLQVHRPVRDMVRARGTGAARTRARAAVHAILAAATPAGWPDDAAARPRRAGITAHVVPSALVDGNGAEARNVVLDQARFLRLSGDFEQSRLLAQLALDRWRERYGEDDPSVLDAARTLADALRDLGEVKAALTLGQEVLGRMRGRYGPDHLDALPAAHGFGTDLRYHGDFEGARELDLDLLRRMRQRHGGDHPGALLAANGVGIDMRLLGRFHDAYEYDHEAFQELRRQPGRGHRDLFRATHHLARDLHGLGLYGDALARQRAGLERPNPGLGPEHAFVLQAKMSHAGTLRKTGRYRESERLAAETLDAHVRRFGPDHPDTAAAKVSHAMACAATGAVRRGHVLLGEAVAGFRAALGAEHPFVHATRVDLGIVQRALGDLQAALETDRAALDALTDGPLGPAHFYALCAAVGLANDYYLLGEFGAADDLASRTRERFVARHGPSHPYTLACAHNHEVIRRELQRTRASAVAPRAGAEVAGPVEELRRVLGADHPEVGAASAGELLECDIEPTSL